MTADKGLTDRQKRNHLNAKARAYYLAAGFLRVDGQPGKARDLEHRADAASEESREISHRIDPPNNGNRG